MAASKKQICSATLRRLSPINPIQKINGIVHWHDETRLLRSVGLRIDVSLDNGKSFRTVGRLETDLTRRIASKSKLGCRLVRSNVKHCLKLDDDRFLIMAGKSIFHLNLNDDSIKCVAPIRGSRPLRICKSGNTIFYGEYRSNPERSPIHVFQSDDEGVNWKIAHTFSDVRHVHGVFVDQIDNSIWITTGDYGDEAAIWRTQDNFRSVEPFLIGSQQTRVIDLVFQENKIYFGTDAPDEANWIYQLDRSSKALEKIQAVGGPIFHALRLRDRCVFTTAKEPSKFNHSRKLEVWELCDGRTSKIAEFKKDPWSMKYFQYGQVIVTSGFRKNDHKPSTCVWLTPFAAYGDQISQLWSLGSGLIGTV